MATAKQKERVFKAAMRFAPLISKHGGYEDHTAYAFVLRVKRACAAATRGRKK